MKTDIARSGQSSEHWETKLHQCNLTAEITGIKQKQQNALRMYILMLKSHIEAVWKRGKGCLGEREAVNFSQGFHAKRCRVSAPPRRFTGAASCKSVGAAVKWTSVHVTGILTCLRRRCHFATLDSAAPPDAPFVLKSSSINIQFVM